MNHINEPLNITDAYLYCLFQLNEHGNNTDASSEFQVDNYGGYIVMHKKGTTNSKPTIMIKVYDVFGPKKKNGKPKMLTQENKQRFLDKYVNCSGE